MRNMSKIYTFSQQSSQECDLDEAEKCRMLVANHQFQPPPRIISEIRKPCTTTSTLDLRPKLTGELLVKVANEHKWWPRRVLIRNGQLHVMSSSTHHLDVEQPQPLRLPLRHLSLRAGALPNSLALCRGQNVVLTIQTINETTFDTWVKTIAIELIRQTPLDSIKYLDIFSFLHGGIRTIELVPKIDQNSNYLPEPINSPSVADHDTVDGAPPPKTVEVEKETVEKLLKKCQNPENYVPVKEKLQLFETLCKLGRKVRSTEDVSCKVGVGAQKRAHSLHDLSSNRAVREMCKFFDSIQQNDDVCKFGTLARPRHLVAATP